MANIVTKDLFVGSINLQKDDLDNITNLIGEFEEKCLIEILGHDLYNKLKDGSENEPYKSLINGKNYDVVYGGINYNVNWGGLKNLLKYYIYCYIRKNDVSSTTANGEIMSVNENGVLVGVGSKINSAWSKFESICGSKYDKAYLPTFYNYMQKFSSDFPTWIFTDLSGNINSHDL